VDTFDSPACAYYSRAYDAEPEQWGWPPEHFADHLDEVLEFVRHHAPAQHPILRHYLRSGDVRCLQVADVPERSADRRVVANWTALGRRWGGVQSQLSFPLLMSPHGHRAFIVGRADPFTAEEMASARRLHRLLAGLDRQISTYSHWWGDNGPAAAEVATCMHLTPRELAVLALLARGLTAATMGRQLQIAERTVQKHLQRCYAKLGVTDRLAAVLRARNLGLLPGVNT
jgi:DNA-binding CsgD family transcriptional regulator